MFSLFFKSRWIKEKHLKINWRSFVIGMGIMALILGRLTESLADPDLWGYLSFGRFFWNHHTIPGTDIFSYTPTKPLWVYHEWLTGVIFYPVYQILGSTGLQGLKYVIGLGTALLIYRTARMRGASPETSVICLLLISPFFGFAYSPVRAQVFTNFFFVLTLYILEKTRLTNHPSYLWWLTPVLLFWANLHGGFVAGLGGIALFAAGQTLSKQRSAPYWLVLAPGSFITLVNPYGLQYWVYLKDALLMRRPDISEWHSVFFALQNGDFSSNILIFFILFILACLMLLASRTRHFSDILLLLATSYLAFKHVRHQSLFFIAMGCLAPLYFTYAENSVRIPELQKDRWKNAFSRFTPIFFVCLLLFFGTRFVAGNPFALTLHHKPPEQSSEDNYPVGAVDFIRGKNFQGNILTEFNWGEYLIWSLPGSRVGMDGRYETVYTDKSSQEYFSFTRGDSGWKEYLDKYPHDMILFRRDGIVTALLLKEKTGWTPVYADQECVLFIRNKKPA
jgi:hypothetical protein